MEVIYAIIIMIFGTMAGSLGPIYLKKALPTLKLNFSALKNKYLWYGCIVYFLGTITFVAILKFVDLSLLYPFVALTYIWVSLFSIKMLKERMNWHKWLGIFLIIVGVVLIGIGG